MTLMGTVFDEKRIIGAYLLELVEDDVTAALAEDEVQASKGPRLAGARRLASQAQEDTTRPLTTPTLCKPQPVTRSSATSATMAGRC
jgi:hypothetical protein